MPEQPHKLHGCSFESDTSRLDLELELDRLQSHSHSTYLRAPGRNTRIRLAASVFVLPISTQRRQYLSFSAKWSTMTARNEMPPRELTTCGHFLQTAYSSFDHPNGLYSSVLAQLSEREYLDCKKFLFNQLAYRPANICRRHQHRWYCRRAAGTRQGA